MGDAPNFVAACPEKDVAFIQRIVENEPVSLRDQVVRLVVEGVRDNWVVYDPLSGCPIANKPSGRVLVAVLAFETWWQARALDDEGDGENATAWRREYWRVIGNFPTCQSFRINRQFGDWLHGIDSSTAGRENPSEWLAWYNRYRQALEEWSAGMRRLEDLEYALQLGDAQEAALRALGVELLDIGVYPTLLGHGLQGDIALVKTGRASAPVVERIRSLLERELRERTGLRASGVPMWFPPLVSAFTSTMWRDPMGEETPADFVLGLLRASTSELPPNFLNPTERQLERANEFLGSCRVTTIKPEFQPKGIKGAPAKTPWTAAREFANLFGKFPIPTERDAKR